MSNNVPKYIQEAIDDLRVKNEKLKKTIYILFLITFCFLGYKEYTAIRYFNFGCVNVIFSNDFIKYESDLNESNINKIDRRYRSLDISELNRTTFYHKDGPYKPFTVFEIYELNKELKNLEVQRFRCYDFLDYHFDL